MIADHPRPGEQIDGGVQAVTSYLTEALIRIPEIELHIISFRLGIDKPATYDESRYVHHLIPFSKFELLTGFRRDQRALDLRLKSISPDIVHAQGSGHQGIVASRSKYPSVITIHGILTEEARFHTGLRRRMRTRAQGWIAQYYCIRRATQTILISPYVSKFYGRSLSGTQHLIPNPIGVEFFNVVRNEDPSKILFVGRLYFLKGVSDLLEAVSMLDNATDLTVVLAGSTADVQYVDKLKAAAVRLGVANNIEFRGILNTEELLRELSECAILVLPSYQETAPMVIQEAMASGVPVVASDICGIPYQVDEGETGFLFPPGDVTALSHRIRTLLGCADTRRRFSTAAKAKAELSFRSEKVAARTVGVYEEILESGNGR